MEKNMEHDIYTVLAGLRRRVLLEFFCILVFIHLGTRVDALGSLGFKG